MQLYNIENNMQKKIHKGKRYAKYEIMQKKIQKNAENAK